MSEPMKESEIIVKGGKDLDGTWGTTKTFTREFYFELLNVPLPLFMISPFIPVYNSLHPVYPFAIAKDSKCTNNIETPRGRGITISTNYHILKPAMPLRGLSEFDMDAVIAGNMPFLLPAQDVTYEPVAVEETIDTLYVERTEEEIEEEIQYWMYHWNLTRQQAEKKITKFWKTAPFQTMAGTKLTGTRQRNILKMSFWYLADPAWFQGTDMDESPVEDNESTEEDFPDSTFDKAAIETNYTGVVNHAPLTIAGRNFPTGTAKIESIEIDDETWERETEEHLQMKRIRVTLLFDKQTWQKHYENVSNLFMAYPYLWQDSDSGKKDCKMVMDEDAELPEHKGKYPMYQIDAENVSPQRIFCTMYDPNPTNEGSSSEPIWVSDPQHAIQFFGTREDCFRLNPDSEPTEVSEPMYLDKNGFVLYPDPDTGKVDVSLSPKVTGYVFEPKDFTLLHFPET